MGYELPHAAKQRLASAPTRIHHILWHVIRDSWHLYSPQQRQTLEQDHPNWVPNIPRFLVQNNQVEINFDAGESFLYMHRQMIKRLNQHLIELDEPEIIGWPTIPELDDPEYPVPDRNPNGSIQDPKSDDAFEFLKNNENQVHDPGILRQISLARLGAYAESYIHDLLHMRWAGGRGIMASFPSFDELQIEIEFDEVFNAVGNDYLGHPYSSHVNGIFWKLHGWVDNLIDRWQQANGLSSISWSDTWTGVEPPLSEEPMPVAMTLVEHNHHEHSHGNGHAHHNIQEMKDVLQLVSGFEGTHADFDYVLREDILNTEVKDLLLGSSSYKSRHLYVPEEGPKK